MTDDQMRAITGPNPDLATIAGEVANATGIPLADILGPRGKRPISRARQIVMWRARRQGATLTAIGQYLNRDHTSVIAGVRRIDQLMKELG